MATAQIYCGTLSVAAKVRALRSRDVYNAVKWTPLLFAF